MRNSTTNRNVFTALTLILMFLLADVFVPSAFPAPELLEEEPTVQRVVSTINPSLDTYIDSDYPNDDYAKRLLARYHHRVGDGQKHLQNQAEQR